MNTKTLSEYINKFIQHLKNIQKCSTKTLQNYNFYLNRFLSWYGPNKKISGINLKSIKQYCFWLSRLSDVHGIPLKINTQNYHLIALRSFLKYLNSKGIKTISPSSILLAKTIPDKIVNLRGGELSRLLEAPVAQENKKTRNQENNQNVTKIRFRDKAILEVLYSTGLRVSELVKLKKTSKLKLLAQARYWLDEYLKTRDDKNPHLFISYDPGNKSINQENKKSSRELPLTTRSVQRIVQKYAKLAGIKKAVTPHTLRHSYRVSQSETD